eukprot:841341-Rhodomonas_salina.1
MTRDMRDISSPPSMERCRLWRCMRASSMLPESLASVDDTDTRRWHRPGGPRAFAIASGFAGRTLGAGTGAS